MTLTVERARELLDYDPETGVLTWKTRRRGPVKKGAVAGNKHSSGYVQIGLDGGRYRAHRLGWLIVHGVWPTDQIDHKNGIRDDNRLVNLREATAITNNENRRGSRPNSRVGLLGVDWHKSSGRFRATISVKGRQRHIGYYQSPDEAYEAYLQVKRAIHSGCTI